MTKAWHYAWAGKSEGPVDDLAIRDLIRAGRIKADTLIWSEGMADWQRADQHFLFAPPPLTTAMPPLPQGAQMPPQFARDGGQGAAPPRAFGEAIKVCFQKYATFKGRASRSEYWWFFLFCIILGFIGGALEGIMGNDGAVLSGIASLATFLPSLSVTVRRLHDTDRSGWWLGGFYLAMIPVGVIAGLIAAAIDAAGAQDPLIGMGLMGLMMLLLFGYSIAILVFLCSKGTPGPNRFG